MEKPGSALGRASRCSGAYWAAAELRVSIGVANTVARPDSVTNAQQPGKIRKIGTGFTA
jgi:hypothetical protein